MNTQSFRRVVSAAAALALQLALLVPAALAQPSGLPPLSTDDLKPGTHISEIEPDSHPGGAKNGLPPGQARYIVVLEDDIEHPGAVATRQARRHDGEVSLVFGTVVNGYAAVLPRRELAALRRNPAVRYVTPDRKMTLAAASVPTGIERVEANDNAQIDIDEGDDLRVDVDVAVLDTGVDPEHPDLNVAGRTHCLPSKFSITVECVDDVGVDRYGHGTHVAGTVGALDNGIGVVGVAPGARIWSVKVLGDGGGGLESWIVKGVEWVTAHAGQIEIANLSIGCGPAAESKPCEQPALAEAIEASTEAGVVYVVAAGNAAADVEYVSPANHPDVITVSALADFDGEAGGEAGATPCREGFEAKYGPFGKEQEDDSLAFFSNYGAGVEVGAPGACILSTVPTEGSTLSPKKGAEAYDVSDGTSMAAPHVAGAAAILASDANPEDLEDVEAIRQTIVEQGEQSWEDGEREPVLNVADDEVFDPSGQRAATRHVTIESASKATLHGEVGPAGEVTSYRFEYGPTPEYGTSTGAQGVGSGGAFVGASQAISGLSAGVTYHYRVVATTGAGTVYGHDRTFATGPPSVDTTAAGEIEAWGAVLTADVDPEGAAASYHFEYGETAEYGRETAVWPQYLAAGSSAVEASQLIVDLDAGTTYHYRIVVENMAGVTYGDDETFTTAAASWPARDSGDDDVRLDDVACGAANDCLAIGRSDPPFETEIVSRHWDGEEWEAVPFPSVEESAPSFEGAVQDEDVEDVSCASPTWCVGIGTFELDEGGMRALAYAWDGEEWSLDISATEAVGAHAEIDLPSVSCISASRCFAVGNWLVPEKIQTGLLIWPGPKGQIGLEWDGETWSEVEIPGRPGADWNWLSTVSCVSATSCIAFGGFLQLEPLFGQGQFAIWDGSEWTHGNDQPAAYFVGTGDEIGCYEEGGDPACWMWWGSGPRYFDGEEWSGASVEVDSPWWEGASDGLARAVSCADAESCAIVGWGAWESAPELRRPFAYAWDGTDWKRQGVEPKGPGAEWPQDDSELRSVACRASACTAVGAHDADAGGAVRPLAVHRQAPTATTEPATGVTSYEADLHGVVDPRGIDTAYRFEYGTTTAYGAEIPATPKAVGAGVEEVEVAENLKGLKADTTYHFRIVAESGGGVSHGSDRTFTADSPGWSADYPSAGGSAWSNLGGVACDADESCVAVGGRDDPDKEGRLAMAQRWDGQQWGLESPPMPAGSSSAGLSDVSCPSSDACIAVGVYREDESQNRRPLVEIWDGAEWTVHAVPQPEGAGYASLNGVSCTAATACMAVGTYTEKSTGGGPHTWFAAKWNGSEWSLSSVPLPGGASAAQFFGVSCTSGSSCVAVGSATTAGAIKPMTAAWNGSGWTAQATPLAKSTSFGALDDIVCIPSGGCIAVGVQLQVEPPVSTLRYAVGWDESTWTLQSVPSSGVGVNSRFDGLSCVSANACLAVGSDYEAGEYRLMAHGWDGSEWTGEYLPEPSTSKIGALRDVSCTDLAHCVAVGEHEYGSLAEIYR